MKPVSEVHIRVIDHGIFLPIARRLARESGKVSYWTPHEKAFPTVRDIIGDGFPDIERVESPWSDSRSVDCWAFPDIGFSQLQRELLNNGAVVWGAREADVLETFRGRFLDALRTTDLPVPPHVKIVGMSALREYLADKKDQFIKVSRFRGDWETLHFRDWAQDEMALDARAARLGPWKEVLPFYVFEKIETKIEDGCDAYCIDGAFPSLVIHGLEAKDKAFLATFQRFADLPEEVRCVNDAFGPILAGYGYRSFFSTEVRITEEGRSYFIDPTLRAGSPPSQLMCEMIGNLGEVIWRGAQGELVEPEPVAQYGVQALLSFKDEHAQWITLVLPGEIEQWVKSGFCSMIEGRLCFPACAEITGGDIGWLLGIGDTAEAAIDHLRHNIELLPCGVTCQFNALADLLREAKEAEKKGMEFGTGPTPDPEVVLKENGS